MAWADSVVTIMPIVLAYHCIFCQFNARADPYVGAVGGMQQRRRLAYAQFHR